VVARLISLMTEKRLRWMPALSMMALVAAAIFLTSCGGGSGGTSSGSSGTPTGTYSISISATAGNGSAQAMHTTVVTLVVQ
jgi:hypothetical protein